MPNEHQEPFDFSKINIEPQGNFLFIRFSIVSSGGALFGKVL